jgi:hypothetical protein
MNRTQLGFTLTTFELKVDYWVDYSSEALHLLGWKKQHNDTTVVLSSLRQEASRKEYQRGERENEKRRNKCGAEGETGRVVVMISHAELPNLASARLIFPPTEGDASQSQSAVSSTNCTTYQFSVILELQ